MLSSDYVMPWGKHKGEKLMDVPRSYIEWVLEQDWATDNRNIELWDNLEDQLLVRDRSGDTY